MDTEAIRNLLELEIRGWMNKNGLECLGLYYNEAIQLFEVSLRAGNILRKTLTRRDDMDYLSQKRFITANTWRHLEDCLNNIRIAQERARELES